MLALFCLSIFIVGCYGQVGYHGNQYVPYTIPSQNGGYATYLRPNYQAIRPLQTEVGLTGWASSATGSGYSGYYTPYSYVLNLQQDRVTSGGYGGSGIGTPLADVQEQKFQPQLVTPRYNIRTPAYSLDSSVQPLGPTPNTVLVVPITDGLATSSSYYSNPILPYGYGGYYGGNYGLGGSYGLGGNYGLGNYGYGTSSYGNYRPLVTPYFVQPQQIQQQQQPQREEFVRDANSDESSARKETTGNKEMTSNPTVV